MLASLPITTELSIILDVTTSNWIQFKKQVIRKSQTHFGRSGYSIRSEVAPPVNTLPTRMDIQEDLSPVFHRLAPTAAQVTANTPPIDLDLSPFGYDLLRDAIKRNLDQQKEDEKDDHELLAHFFSHMSSNSHLALETHASYPLFLAAAPGQKSFTCWTILTNIHSTGSASSKLDRTQRLLQCKQGDLSLSQFLRSLSENIEQFKQDFGTAADPELISINQLHCFLMVTGVPSNGLYNLPINQLLAATPTARFTDPTALATTLLNWERSSSLLHLSDQPSIQASSYLATTPQQRHLPTSPHSNPPPHCIHCARKYPDKKKTSSHTSDSCGLNPNKIKNPSLPNYTAMRSLLAQAEAAPQGSTDSIGLLLQITETALDASQQSNN